MTTFVHRLTDGQAKSLQKRKYTDAMYFNPETDADGLWFISVEEVDQCNQPGFSWLKRLPLIPYKPKPTPPMPGMEQTP